MKHLIISDIHGNFTDLQAMDDYLTDDMVPVFLGDYIDDFGPTQPLQVLDYIRDKVENHHGIALLGNHDNFWLQTADGDYDAYAGWKRNGGKYTWTTLGIDNKSFAGVREFLNTELSDYTEFLRQLPLTYSDENRFYVHAGINWEHALNEQSRRDLLWIRGDYYYTKELAQYLQRFNLLGLWQVVGKALHGDDIITMQQPPYHRNDLGKVIVTGHTPTFLITGNDSMPIVKMQHDENDVPRYVIDGGSPARTESPAGINLLGLNDDGTEFLNERMVGK
ncbi:MAG: metallophosphoesterase [Lactobacillaceae bacterium]|jgi:serine/threonine protein phosphatase 1|nr:metallophosphoesterase [Lactobacillaceae bacterium]